MNIRLLYIAISTLLILSIQKEVSSNETAKGKGNGPLQISFDDYIVKFHKKYGNASEKEMRRFVFEENVKQLKETRCKACGITKFTDRTPQEVQKLKGARLSDKSNLQSNAQADSKVMLTASGAQAKANVTNSTNSSIPKSFDWRDYNVITSIKDQGSCGSCWTFSTVAFFESQLIRRGQAKNTIDLAEQFLLQCDTGSKGCIGGNLYSATNLALGRGLPFESSYPYAPKFSYPGICLISRGPTFPYTNQVVTYSNTDDQIIKYLLQRPLNIGVMAKEWQKYAPTSEDRTFECSQLKNGIKDYNHAVLLIGYTQKQWIVKNQWGTDWGIDGFMYVTRDKKSNCGIGLEIHTLDFRLNSVLNLTNSTTNSTTNSNINNSTVPNSKISSGNTPASSNLPQSQQTQKQATLSTQSRGRKLYHQALYLEQELQSSNSILDSAKRNLHYKQEKSQQYIE